MAKQERIRTKYNGVFLVASVSPATGKPDNLIYIRYKKDGKLTEERVGRTSVDAMTPAKASLIRADRIRGKDLPNTERRAAEKAAKQAEAERWTVEKIFEAYQEAHPDQVSSKAWESLFKSHVLPEVGDRVPGDLCTLDIERLRRKVAKKNRKGGTRPLSDQTVKHVLSLLKRVLRWAADRNYIEVPAHLKFTMPRVDNQVTETMTPEQASAYFRALDEETDRDSAAYFRIMILTGIRKSALLSLRWDDIDLDRGFVTLRGSSAKSGKTSTIPLSAGAIEIFKGMSKKTITSGEKKGQLSPYVWPGMEGGMRADFQRMGRRLREKAGLPKSFRPCHGLRHCYASWLASSGKVDLYTLQRLLTHGSPAMTQRYAHLADEALKRAASVADSILEVGQEKYNAVGENHFSRSQGE